MQNFFRYTHYDKYIHLVIIIVLATLNIYFYYDINYWFDEWATFLVSDPNITLHRFFSRLDGNLDNSFIPENVPYLYYLILRNYFDLLGYNPENGRLFSLVFYILSLILLYFILSLHNSRKISFVISLLFSLNPYFLYVGMEMRVGVFFTFITLLTTYVFLKNFEKRNFNLYFLLLLLNVFSLTLYPILICLIICQFIFVVIIYLNFKKIDYYFFIFFFLSILLYLLINYNYLIDKVDTTSSHWAKLNINFFGLFFNIYFNSILLGFLILLFFYFIVFFKKNFWINNFLLLYSIILILVSYFFVIISSIYFVPVSSPKYIVFILPFLYIFLCINFYNIFKNYNTYLLKYLIIFFVLINVFTTDNKWLKKPDTDVALNIINSKKIDNIYVDPDSLHFNFFYNHLKNLNYIDRINFNVFYNNFENVKIFAHLCLNNPRYNIETHSELKNHKICQREFKNFYKTQSFKTEDYLIIFFKKISS